MMSEMHWGWGGMIYGPFMMIGGSRVSSPGCAPGALARWAWTWAVLLTSFRLKPPWTCSRNGLPKAKSTRMSSRSDGAC